MTDDTDPTTDAEPPRSGLRRSQRGGIVIVLVVVAVVGLAAGADVSPSDVKEAVLQRLYGDPEPQIDRAPVVASDSSETSSVEVLLAPTDRGPGECIVIGTEWLGRSPDGSTGEGSQRVRCWFDGPVVDWYDPEFRIVRPSDRFGLLMEAPIGPVGVDGGAVALVGVVYDDVETITVDFGDDAQYTFKIVTDDGWFAAILPAGVADIDRLSGALVNKVVSLKLVDAEGRVLATVTPNSVNVVDYE